jgi:hypothetical protein
MRKRGYTRPFTTITNTRLTKPETKAMECSEEDTSVVVSLRVCYKSDPRAASDLSYKQEMLSVTIPVSSSHIVRSHFGSGESGISVANVYASLSLALINGTFALLTLYQRESLSCA